MPPRDPRFPERMEDNALALHRDRDQGLECVPRLPGGALERTLRAAAKQRGVLATVVTETIRNEHGMDAVPSRRHAEEALRMLPPAGQVQLLAALSELHGWPFDPEAVPTVPELIEGTGVLLLVPNFGSTAATSEQLLTALSERAVPGLDRERLPGGFFDHVRDQEAHRPALSWRFLAFRKAFGILERHRIEEFGIDKAGFSPGGIEALVAMLYEPGFLRNLGELTRTGARDSVTLALEGIPARISAETLNETVPVWLRDRDETEGDAVDCFLQLSQSPDSPRPSCGYSTARTLKRNQEMFGRLSAWSLVLDEAFFHRGLERRNE